MMAHWQYIIYYNTYTADVNFEDGATVNLIDNDVSAINNDGKVYIGNGTTIMNNGSKTVYGGGIQNRGDITIAPNVKLYNNHAKVAGDDIYNTTGTSANGLTSYTGSITFAPVGDGWILDDCKEEHPIVGWYHDGKEKLTDNAYKRWNGDGEGDAYYADEYTVGKEAVSDALALKAAHGQLCSVTYEVTGDIPSDAGAVPAAAKVKKGGSYTVAPVQTTSQSRYTFSGWRINGSGDVVTEIKDIQQDVKLIGVWTRRSSGGGGGSSKPTVDIPDDVPTSAHLVGQIVLIVRFAGVVHRHQTDELCSTVITQDPSLDLRRFTSCRACGIVLTVCVAVRCLCTANISRKTLDGNRLPFPISERSPVSGLRQTNKQGKGMKIRGWKP
mgnify:CR=1 FL=1